MSENQGFRRSNRIANLNRKPEAPKRNLQPFVYVDPNLRKIKLECDYVPVVKIKKEPKSVDGSTLSLGRHSKSLKRKAPKVIDLNSNDCDDVVCLTPKENPTKGTKVVEVCVNLILRNNNNNSSSGESSNNNEPQQHTIIFDKLPIPLIDTHHHQQQFITLNCILKNDIGKELSLKISTNFKEENWNSRFNEGLKTIDVVIELKPDFFAHITQETLDKAQLYVDDSWTQFCKKHFLI